MQRISKKTRQQSKHLMVIKLSLELRTNHTVSSGKKAEWVFVEKCCREFFAQIIFIRELQVL